MYRKACDGLLQSLLWRRSASTLLWRRLDRSNAAGRCRAAKASASRGSRTSVATTRTVAIGWCSALFRFRPRTSRRHPRRRPARGGTSASRARRARGSATTRPGHRPEGMAESRGDCLGLRRAWCLQLLEHPRVPWGLGLRLRLRGRVLSAVAFRLYPADVQHRAAQRGPAVRRRQALWIERNSKGQTLVHRNTAPADCW